jgi:hypothetical protein
MEKSHLVYSAVLVVLLVVLVGIHVLKSSDCKWHKSMASEMHTRDTCIELKSRAVPSGFDDRALKSSAAENLILADKIILLQVARKPAWTSFTEEEAQAVKAAKADLGQN